MICAEQAVMIALGDHGQEYFEEFQPYITLGAQGPDLFYHNRRRKPSGITYGALVHRGGYGRLTIAMIEQAIGSESVRSPAAAYLAGWITHAVLDRTLHPYINYHAGSARHGHVFLERLLDTETVRLYYDARPDEIGFWKIISRIDSHETVYIELITGLLEPALRFSYRSARSDPELSQKIRNAVLDSLGFYAFTDPSVARQRALESTWRTHDPRLIALLHLPETPGGLDLLNDSGGEWFHPCSPDTAVTTGYTELFREACSEAGDLLRGFFQAWSGNSRELIPDPGNGNLSDGGPPGENCPKPSAPGLPLAELLRQIASDPARYFLPPRIRDGITRKERLQEG